jgi:hypothetical protein
VLSSHARERKYNPGDEYCPSNTIDQNQEPIQSADERAAHIIQKCLMWL